MLPIAWFIQAQVLHEQSVMVYRKLLPSLAFNLDRNIITISDETKARDVENVDKTVVSSLQIFFLVVLALLKPILPFD